MLTMTQNASWEIWGEGKRGVKEENRGELSNAIKYY
jgi:hypothetical protein